MEKIDKNVKQTINKIKTKYGNSADVNDRIIKIKGTNVGCIFLESSSQTSTISDFIIKSIVYIEKDKNIFNSIQKLLENKLYNCQLFTIENFEEVKASLQIILASYDQVLYTPDQLKQAKQDKATLNKLKRAIAAASSSLQLIFSSSTTSSTLVTN